MLLHGLAILLVCQLVGEFVARSVALPVPGPVLGTLLLFAFLCWRGGPSPGLRTAAEGLLRYLALLFVPAGVGLKVHFARIGDDAMAIVAALVVSTALALAVTGILLNRLQRRRPPS